MGTYRSMLIIRGIHALGEREMSSLSSGSYSKVRNADVVVCIADGERRVVKDREGRVRRIGAHELAELRGASDNVTEVNA